MNEKNAMNSPTYFQTVNRMMVPLAMHSRSNVQTGNAYRHQGGELSTVMSGSVNDPRLNQGRPTLIPFVWNGRIVEEPEAIALAIQSGQEWPAFRSHDDATVAAKRLSSSLPTTAEGWRNFRWPER